MKMKYYKPIAEGEMPDGERKDFSRLVLEDVHEFIMQEAANAGVAINMQMYKDFMSAATIGARAMYDVMTAKMAEKEDKPYDKSEDPNTDLGNYRG
jgi:3-deoxy-D-arabino-heptulosonate 7-phosphate (DAHP) synthase